MMKKHSFNFNFDFASKVSRFWAIYLAVVMVLVVGISIWLMQLNRMMAAYEASMPKYVAEKAVASLSAGDFSGLYDKLEPAQRSSETLEQFSEYMAEQTLGKALSFAPAYSPAQDEERFAVSADGEAFAELTLRPSEVVDGYGNHSWTVERITASDQPMGEYFITAYDTSTVYVDGEPISEAYIVEADIPTEAAGHLPDKIHTPTMTKYRVQRSFSVPTFRVVDKDGEEQQLLSVTENTYEAQLNYNAALRKSQAKRAVEIAKAYGQFTIGRKTKNQFLKYVLSGTKPDTMIHEYDDRWYIKNKSYKFQNVTAEKFYAYAKNCYSCVITYDLELVATNGKSQTYPTSVTLYLYKTDAFKIYDMVIGK